MTARRLIAAELPAPLGPRLASRSLDMQAEVGMWVARCWNAGLAHGCELVGRHMPAGWFPADADDTLRDLEELGFIERATELPTPTPEQAFFGTAGVDVKKCSKPGMRHHLQRSWWGWRPVRTSAAYAAWIAGGPMPPPTPPPALVTQEAPPPMGDPLRHTRTAPDVWAALLAYYEAHERPPCMDPVSAAIGKTSRSDVLDEVVKGFRATMPPDRMLGEHTRDEILAGLRLLTTGGKTL